MRKGGKKRGVGREDLANLRKERWSSRA